MYKIIQFTKAKELEGFLNGNWVLVGSFTAQGKSFFILKK